MSNLQRFRHIIVCTGCRCLYGTRGIVHQLHDGATGAKQGPWYNINKEVKSIYQQIFFQAYYLPIYVLKIRRHISID